MNPKRRKEVLRTRLHEELDAAKVAVEVKEEVKVVVPEVVEEKKKVVVKKPTLEKLAEEKVVEQPAE